MSRGGPRNGAGRKKGSRSRSRVEVESRLKKLNCDPIAGLVAISKDEKASIDVKARVLIELAGYCHAKQRPTPERRRIALDGATLEAQGRAVVAAIGSGELSPDEGAALLNGLARQGELERLGLLADVVALLASRAGIEVPDALKLRQRIPATLNQEPSP
jgi:hypothetical protein